jgi:hypothetical protein
MKFLRYSGLEIARSQPKTLALATVAHYKEQQTETTVGGKHVDGQGATGDPKHSRIFPWESKL